MKTICRTPNTLWLFLGDFLSQLPKGFEEKFRISGLEERELAILKEAGYIYWPQIRVVSDITLLKVPNVGLKLIKKLREKPEAKELDSQVLLEMSPYLKSIMDKAGLFKFGPPVIYERGCIFNLETVSISSRSLVSTFGEYLLNFDSTGWAVHPHAKSIEVVDGICLVYREKEGIPEVIAIVV